MKKLFVLTSVLALGAISALAQGYINPSSSGGVTTFITVQDPGVNNNVAAKIGTPATKAGFGAGSGPGQVTFSLYAAAGTQSLQVLQSSPTLATGLNAAGTGPSVQGAITIAAGSLQLPSQAGYDGSGLVSFAYYASTSDGKYTGWSSVATVQPITSAQQAAAGTPTPIWGTTAGLINGMVLTPVPEPATIALGGLGAAALLLFRRRK